MRIICVQQKYQESLKIVDSLGRLQIHITLSNPNVDVRIFAQGYCVAIINLSSL